MNLYVLPENQKLIWDTISKTKLFQQLSSNHDGGKWFQSIIQEFYHKIQHRQINKDELRILNKETVVYMIQKLKDQFSFQPVSFDNTFSNSFNTLEPNISQTRDFLLEKKQNELNTQFELRQNEYEDLNKKPKIEEINFQENDSDKPIENMEELLQKQLQERSYDIEPNTKDTPPQIETIDLGKDEKKSVSWDPELNSPKKQSTIDELETKMNQFILDVQSQLNSLRNEIEILKNDRTMDKKDDAKLDVHNMLLRLQSIEKTVDQNKTIVVEDEIS